MDLEGFVRKRILKGSKKDEIIKGLVELVLEFKEWEKDKALAFSEAVYEEVGTSIKYKRLDDPFIKNLLEYPRSGVLMGEFGVGSRGTGDFEVHRDIADIVGKKGALISPKDQDDAGVVEGKGRYVTVAVDGIHSRLSEYPFLAGFHAARAALRDVCVMGSSPVALISDLHLADDGDIGKLYDYTAGVSAVGDATLTPLVSGSTLRVGGDMVFGDRLVAAVGAVGVSATKPFARRNAREGDVIFLTLGRGGGTIATTAIFSGHFNVVKETLNVDFMRSMEAVFQKNLHSSVHAMTDVTNGGLRGDASEISKTAKKRIVFFEEKLRKTVSEKVLKMLDDLKIDYLGVSTDSLMFIVPEEKAEDLRKVLGRTTSIYEVGYVEKGEDVGIISRDREEKELKPLFRESAYTKVKKIVGESRPQDLEEKRAALVFAKKAALKKKEEIKKWMIKG